MARARWRLSKAREPVVLHVDIGGGTTKLALIDNGTILGVCAFAVGGRLIAADADGAWTRIEQSARMVADELGLTISRRRSPTIDVRRRIAQRLAESPSTRSSARRSTRSANRCCSPSRCRAPSRRPR